MARSHGISELLRYLASCPENGKQDRCSSLGELSRELGLSVSVLREQLEVAKALGLVEVKPKTGIRKNAYSFFPAVQQSLSFAILLSPDYFTQYADLRNHLEACFWQEAVSLLIEEDLADLQSCISRAWSKLRGNPTQIPQEEHRELHLIIYRRLENPFVIGILEGYWDAYEKVGLNLYYDLEYHQEVWRYHEQMVDAILRKDFDAGYKALVMHKDLLFHRQLK